MTLEYSILRAVSSEFSRDDFFTPDLDDVGPHAGGEDYARVGLMMWALAVNKFRLARLFWRGTRESLHTALVATAVLGEFASLKQLQTVRRGKCTGATRCSRSGDAGGGAGGHARSACQVGAEQGQV